MLQNICPAAIGKLVSIQRAEYLLPERNRDVGRIVMRRMQASLAAK